MRIPRHKNRRIDLACPKCGQLSVYSFAPAAIQAPGLYGVGRRLGGRTPWTVECTFCPGTMTKATGKTEEEAVEAFKKRSAQDRESRS